MDLAKLRAQLTRHEGLHLRPYVDSAGKVTIGVGRNLTDTGITSAEADVLLGNDVDRVVTECYRTVTRFAVLDDVRQRALADMAFNLGLPRFLGFEKMLAAVVANDYPIAADEMLASHWARQVGARATELAAMLRTGTESAA